MGHFGAYERTKKLVVASPVVIGSTAIRAAFSEGWEVESIEPTVIDLTWDPAGALSWRVAATRR